MAGLVGTIDAYRDGQLIGWAWDPRDPNRRIPIDVLIDGELRAQIKADALRLDLADAGIGDGRYAFFLQLCDLITDGSQSADLRFAETGERLSHSPVALADTFWPHRARLTSLLDSAPFSLSHFSFDGLHFDVAGFYHPIHGELSGITLVLDGAPPVELTWDPPDDHVKRDFWFVNPKSAGFRARFAMDSTNATNLGAVQLRLIDPTAPLDALRDYYIPSSVGDYQNVPSAKRQKRVMGWSNAARFVFLGRTHYEAIRNLARRYGFPTDQMKKILDFGVGCGRIARHFLAHDPHIELHGVDIDTDNLRWCTEHLPSGHFQASPPVPPLPYVDCSFDFVYANSIFTHLTEEMQDLWLAEIARILTPTGIAVITFHGETAAAWARMPLQWLDQWAETGIDATGLNRDLAGFIEDEKYYRNTYHTAAYVHAHWSRYVEILGIHRQLFGYQDAVVVRPHRSIR